MRRGGGAEIILRGFASEAFPVRSGQHYARVHIVYARELVRRVLKLRIDKAYLLAGSEAHFRIDVIPGGVIINLVRGVFDHKIGAARAEYLILRPAVLHQSDYGLALLQAGEGHFSGKPVHGHPGVGKLSEAQPAVLDAADGHGDLRSGVGQEGIARAVVPHVVKHVKLGVIFSEGELVCLSRIQRIVYRHVGIEAGLPVHRDDYHARVLRPDGGKHLAAHAHAVNNGVIGHQQYRRALAHGLDRKAVLRGVVREPFRDRDGRAFHVDCFDMEIGLDDLGVCGPLYGKPVAEGIQHRAVAAAHAELSGGPVEAAAGDRQIDVARVMGVV